MDTNANGIVTKGISTGKLNTLIYDGNKNGITYYPLTLTKIL